MTTAIESIGLERSQILLCGAADQASLQQIYPRGVSVLSAASSDWPRGGSTLAGSWAVSHGGADEAGNHFIALTPFISCFPTFKLGTTHPLSAACGIIVRSILTPTAAARVAGAAGKRGSAIGGSETQVRVGS